MQAAWGRCCHTPFQVCSTTLILFCPFARILIAHFKQLEFLRKFFDSRPNFDPRMALKGPSGDFAGESPEAPNAHLTSLPNAKKDMFNVGRRQCLEKRNTGTDIHHHHTTTTTCSFTDETVLAHCTWVLRASSEAKDRVLTNNHHHHTTTTTTTCSFTVQTVLARCT